MKRILCILITVMMLFSVTAGAAGLEDIAVMSNYTAEMNLTVTVDKPITIFSKLPELKEVFYYVDLDALVESLLGTKININVQADISKDFNKMQAKILMSTSTPLKINQNASVTGDFVVGMWADVDIADEENPKFDIILRDPTLNKYLTVDVADMAKDSGLDLSEFIKTLKQTLNSEAIASVSDSSLELIRKNATVSSGNNTINIILDEKGANQYIYDTIELAFKQAFSYSDEFSTETFEEYKEYLEPFKNIDIFGENGIRIQYILDRWGNIKSTSAVYDLEFNIYYLLEKADVTGITKEDCDFALTLTETAQYSRVGTTTVEFPELTEENSVTYDELYGYDNDYEEDYEEYPPYYISFGEDENTAYEDGVIYVGIRAFFDDGEHMHYYYKETPQHFEYNYVDGVLTVKNLGCAFYDFSEIVITNGSDLVIVDGREITLDHPVREINDRILLSVDFYEKVLGYRCDYATIELLEGGIYVRFIRIEEE